jgi:hypothetical protein
VQHQRVDLAAQGIEHGARAPPTVPEAGYEGDLGRHGAPVDAVDRDRRVRRRRIALHLLGHVAGDDRIGLPDGLMR